MPLLKHPTAETIIDVTGARAKALKERGYTEADADDAAHQAAMPSGTQAVQPQPPIDTRPNPPEPPVEARPDELITDPPIDTRPPNPLGETADSVKQADGAGLAKDGDEPPAKSATKDEWVAYAEAHGVEDAADLTKSDLQKRFAS